jgi:hypothetical protein
VLIAKPIMKMRKNAEIAKLEMLFYPHIERSSTGSRSVGGYSAPLPKINGNLLHQITTTKGQSK